MANWLKKIDSVVWVLLFVFLANVSIFPLHSVWADNTKRVDAGVDAEEGGDDETVVPTLDDMEQQVADERARADLQKDVEQEVSDGHTIENFDPNVILPADPNCKGDDCTGLVNVKVPEMNKTKVMNPPSLKDGPVSIWIIEEEYGRTYKNLILAKNNEIPSVELRFYPKAAMGDHILDMYFEARYHNPTTGFPANLGGEQLEIPDELMPDNKTPKERRGLTYADFVASNSTVFKEYKDLWGNAITVRKAGGIGLLLGSFLTIAKVVKVLKADANNIPKTQKWMRKMLERKPSRFGKYWLTEVALDKKALNKYGKEVTRLKMKGWFNTYRALKRAPLKAASNMRRWGWKAGSVGRGILRVGANAIATLSNPKLSAFIAVYIGVELYYHWSQSLYAWSQDKLDSLFYGDQFAEREWLAQMLLSAQSRMKDNDYFMSMDHYNMKGGLENFMNVMDGQKVVLDTPAARTQRLEDEKAQTPRDAWDLVQTQMELGQVVKAFSNFLDKDKYMKHKTYEDEHKVRLPK